MVKLSNAFPGGTFICAHCEEKCDSDYQMKEHIMLHHTWISLEALVVESEKEGGHIEFAKDDKSNEEYETRPDKDSYKEMLATEKSSKNWQKDKDKERKRKASSRYTTESDLTWACGTTYSCNYCDKIYNRIPLARSHILKIHKTKMVRGDYPNHMSFESKKYSCQICHQQIEHNLDNIRTHTLKKHRMKIQKYAASYEMTASRKKRTKVDPYVKIPKDPVIPGMETLPEEMQSFLNKIRAKSATVNASSSIVPTYDYPIEFSDSSDDEG